MYKMKKRIDFIFIEHDVLMSDNEIEEVILSENVRRYNIFISRFNKGNCWGKYENYQHIFEGISIKIPLDIKIKRIQNKIIKNYMIVWNYLQYLFRKQ